MQRAVTGGPLWANPSRPHGGAQERPLDRHARRVRAHTHRSSQGEPSFQNILDTPPPNWDLNSCSTGLGSAFIPSWAAWGAAAPALPDPAHPPLLPAALRGTANFSDQSSASTRDSTGHSRHPIWAGGEPAARRGWPSTESPCASGGGGHGEAPGRTGSPALSRPPMQTSLTSVTTGD